jgi:predicted DNA binding CopG/RHH family protein
VLAELKEKQEALNAKLAAMTPEERAEWDKEQAIREQETEEILKKLRGPGFFEAKF